MVVACLLIAAGLATGFFTVTMTTEIYEESAMGFSPPAMDGSRAEPGMDMDTLTVLKVATTALAMVGLLWLAWRSESRGRPRLGLWILVAGATTPVWFAFFEVDHAEAYIATAVAASLAWASLALPLDRTRRSAMVLVHVMAAVQFDAAFNGHFSWSGWHSAIALASTVAFVAATLLVPRDGRVRWAAPIGAASLGVTVLPFAVLDIQESGFASDYLVVALGAVATVVLVAATWRQLRATPEPRASPS